MSFHVVPLRLQLQRCLWQMFATLFVFCLVSCFVFFACEAAVVKQLHQQATPGACCKDATCSNMFVCNICNSQDFFRTNTFPYKGHKGHKGLAYLLPSVLLAGESVVRIVKNLRTRSLVMYPSCLNLGTKHYCKFSKISMPAWLFGNRLVTADSEAEGKACAIHLLAWDTTCSSSSII